MKFPARLAVYLRHPCRPCANRRAIFWSADFPECGPNPPAAAGVVRRHEPAESRLLPLEVTGERLKELPQLSQLVLLLTRHQATGCAIRRR